jgi:hypothetical protein
MQTIEKKAFQTLYFDGNYYGQLNTKLPLGGDATMI